MTTSLFRCSQIISTAGTSLGGVVLQTHRHDIFTVYHSMHLVQVNGGIKANIRCRTTCAQEGQATIGHPFPHQFRHLMYDNSSMAFARCTINTPAAFVWCTDLFAHKVEFTHYVTTSGNASSSASEDKLPSWHIMVTSNERQVLDSPASRLFVRQFIQPDFKGNIKPHITGQLWDKSTCDRCIPLTEGQ